MGKICHSEPNLYSAYLNCRRNKGWLSGALNVASKVASVIPGGGLISSVLDIGNAALGMVPGGGGGGGGGGRVMGGGGGMISGQAPAVNINLDGVRKEMANFRFEMKKETDDIKDALRDQGEQLQDIKVNVIGYTIRIN